MKFAVMLVGESFRLGGQGTRFRDSNESYEGQKSACLSHVELAERFAGLADVDFFIESYETKYESDMIFWYGSRLKACSLNKNLVGIRNLALSGMKKIDDSYDFVFVCRVDVLLKPMMLDLFDPNWDKILFPFVCWINAHLERGVYPRVSDMMMFVPKRLVGRMRKEMHMHHDSWAHLVGSGIVSRDDIGTMIDTYHDSDSAKDYNPLYTIVNRNRCDFWHSIGYLADEHMMPVRTEERRSFPDLDPLYMVRRGNQDFSAEGMWEWWHQDLDGLFRFVDLIGFAENHTILHYESPEVKYWEINGKYLTIIGNDKNTTAIMEKMSDDVYIGKYKNEKITFMIEKVKQEKWMGN